MAGYSSGRGNRLLYLGALTLLVALGSLFLQPPPALGESTYCSGSDDNNAPDFSDNDDILNGRRYLAMVEDLVIPLPVPGDSGSICSASDDQMAFVNYVAYTDDNAVSSMSTDCVTNVTVDDDQSSFPYPARGARLADFSYDHLVSLAQTDTDGGMAVYVQDCSDTSTGCTTVSTTTFTTTDQTRIQMAVDDFNLDGYDDILVIGADNAFVLSASDTSSSFDGTLTTGDSTTTGTTYSPYGAPVVGDFNDDGNEDVAWISDGGDGSALTVYFATVCGGDLTDDTVCDTSDTFDIILSPLSSGNISLSASDSERCASELIGTLAAGNFDSSSDGDELAATYCTKDSGTSSGQGYMNVYDFDGEFTPTYLGNTQAVHLDYIHVIITRSGNLDWFSDTDQIVLAASGTNDDVNDLLLRIYSVDNSSGTVTITEEAAWEERYSDIEAAGVAVGRFTTETTDESDYDLSIGLSWTLGDPDTDGHDLFIGLFTVFDSDGNYDLEASGDDVTIAGPYTDDTFLDNYKGQDRLWPADLQGRATRLGAPEVVRITGQVQPMVALGMPPAHMDWITPDSTTSSSASLVNLSFTPSNLNAVFNLTTTESSQSSTTNTTSYTYSYKETESGSAKFSVPLVSSISASTTDTTEQSYSSYVSSTYDTYESVSYNAYSATDMGDVLWFQQYDLTLYYYPVLGELVCDSDDTDCSDPSEPLYVVYSGVSEVCTTMVDGNTAEWYQPYTEPGNVFSYPWSQDLLETEIDGLSLLSDAANFFSGVSASQTVSWSSELTSEASTGSTTTNSFETSDSITAGTADLEKAEDGASVSVSFDYSESESVDTAATNTSVLGESTGVTIYASGDTLDEDLYQYEILPFIFGQSLPDGTQNILDGCDDVTDNTDCNSTTGVLRLGFGADPSVSGSGSWWAVSDYQSYIDVALNHPQRWTNDPDSECSSLNCLGEDCVSFNESTTDSGEVWDNEFFSLRGLLVQVGAASGPQQQNATAGDDVYLTARVYNYSFLDLDDTYTLHVQFYRQEWDSTSNAPVSNTDSVLIEEVTVDMSDDLLPGFNSSGDPNWQEVTTSFDTTDLGDTYQVFWVLVWATDSSDDLVSEVPGHGLTDLPDTISSIGFVTDVVSILDTASWTQDETDGSNEECKSKKYKDIPFSNNVGLLKIAFYIASAEESETLGPRGATRAAKVNGDAVSVPSLRLENLKAVPSVAFLNERVAVKGDVTASGKAAHGIMMTMFQGEPKNGEMPKDVTLLAHVGDGGSHHFQLYSRPRTAGEHEMVVVAGPGTTKETVGRTSLKVMTEATALESARGYAFTGGSEGGPGTMILRTTVQLERDDFSLSDFNLNTATLTVYNLLSQRGREFFAGSSDAEWAPMTMSLWKRESRFAIFHGSSGTTTAWVRLWIQDGGQGTLTLKASGSSVENPDGCNADSVNLGLDTRLVLDDGTHEPVLIRLGGQWECTSQPDGGAMLTR